MRKLQVRCWLSFLSVVWLASTAATAADDPHIRRDMLRLTHENPVVRHEAIDALVRTSDVRLAYFLSSYQQGSIYLYGDRLVLCENPVFDDHGNKFAHLSDPLTRARLLIDQEPEIVAFEELKSVGPSRRERGDVADALSILNLTSPEPARRLAAVRSSRKAKFVPHLEKLLRTETVGNIHYAARERILLIRLAGLTPDGVANDRLSAARDLAGMRSRLALPVLENLIKDLDAAVIISNSPDARTRDVYRQAIDEIEGYQRYVRAFEYLFSGISLGSILILMALGLSIIFGQMGVINMAHGELMMIGAYATYEIQNSFVAYLPASAFNWYLVLALPTAFIIAGLIGYVIEFSVVRHLYGRPLETLLATWGISLILIQSVRVIYGDNIAVNNPTWLRGGAEIVQDVIVPFNRCFVLIVCALSVSLIYYLMNHTTLGLLLRATTQNREMANSLGVNTRRIDGHAFAIGAGLAGIAGCTLTLIGGVTPDMGQNYIVDSFLVVVTGGVGELAGTIVAGLGLGVLNKALEPVFAAVWSKVLILLAVIAFIQWRPAGLFPPKGRHADA